jgi:hypothetical protein
MTTAAIVQRTTRATTMPSFDSHEAMMRGAATEVIDRISARLESHRAGMAEARDRSAVVENMLAEMLPLDEHTSREMVVWLEFSMAARTVPALGEAADRLHAGVRSLAAIILERSGTVPREAVAVETERLAALIDGLAMGGALHPGELPPAMSRAVIRRHLEALGVHS